MGRLLSASRLNGFLGCAHQSALWLDGVEAAPVEDPTLELIRAKGFEHEAKVLGALEGERGAAVSIKGEEPLETRVLQTLAAMETGAELIFQGALTGDRWMGLPDYLVRRARPDVGYDPEDAKLARKPKPSHVLQLALYADLLERRGAGKLGRGLIRVAGGPPVRFDLREFRFILRRLMRDFEAFVDTPSRVTRAAPCKACRLCDYQARCQAEWRAADSVFFVAGVSFAQVLKLEAAGITTLDALARAAPNTSVSGMESRTVAKLSAQARLQRQARDTGAIPVETLPLEAGRGFHLLPNPDPGDLYFDMEGDPLYDEGLEYLFGLWGPVNSAQPHFTALWAHDRPAEKAAFEKLIDVFVNHFDTYPHAHIYHYAQYEPNALKRLAMLYATREAELDQMLRDRRFVDLYTVARQGLRAGVESYSLKDLEKIYWAGREGAVTTAADSIVQYENWRATGEQSILDAIESYNKDDCVSTGEMHLWLESLRPAGAVYQIIGETGRDTPEKIADRRALEVRRWQTAAKVRASDAGDEALREMVAELLWFHQRAQKPGWWALFDRQIWTDDDLVDDAESLGALTRDKTIEPVPDKQSLLWTFKFPPQDTKLKIGGTPRIAATLANAGTIVDLNIEKTRVVLRRSVRAGAYPETFSLLSAPINQQNLPFAVLNFADRFAANQLADDRALMSFLQRQAPKFRGRAHGAPIAKQGADLVGEVIAAVSDLDSSYLFIQGPPGTGKTYTISRVVLELIQAGHRVGIASNAHKAINKVLEEVDARAAEADVSFSGAKKGNEDDPETHHDSDCCETVFQSGDVSRHHQVVGGTAFHFCRDDQQGEYDYLIVDEAGQVSLGNLVAMAGAARNLVLVGDQMQLAQPIQGVHPGESGLSSLDYLLQGAATVAPAQGILLNESRRMHPDICKFISDAIYDSKLEPHASTADRHLVMSADAHPAIAASGITFLRTESEGARQVNRAEVTAIVALVKSLLNQRVRVDGQERPLTESDILVVAPYNMQVNLLRESLPEAVRVGTVDKFQGQEAPVVILSMTTSRASEAPRGTNFLFNKNRINVAVSRAQCLAIVVHGSHLIDGGWSSIEDLKRVNLFAHAEASAAKIVGPLLV